MNETAKKIKTLRCAIHSFYRGYENPYLDDALNIVFKELIEQLEMEGNDDVSMGDDPAYDYYD